MARTFRARNVEDATLATPAGANAQVPAPVRGSLKTMLEIGQRCVHLSELAAAAQTEALKEFASALATATSSVERSGN